MKNPIRIALPAAAAAAVLLSACASGPMGMSKPFDQAMLPAPVQVPAGNKVAMETIGAGDITYECKAKAGAPGQFEWTFVGPDAKLMDRAGKQVGKYYGPPATWENMDGSKVTATQVAVAPAMAGSIPFQLVKANPAMGSGAMTGTTYIQRVATQGRRRPRHGVRHGQHRRQGSGEVPGRLHLLQGDVNPVIPAEAGIQCVRLRGLFNTEALDSRLRGNDDEARRLSLRA
jgi:hypothetical protein